MGNSSEKPPLPSSLTPITDPHYGGNIYLDSTKTKAYQILDIDESSRQSFTNLLNSRKQLSHPALVSVNRTWVQDYRQNCSLQKMYRVTVEYSYIPFTLQDQIKKYCQMRRPVPEPLIRKYFSDAVSCLEYLRSKGTCHGDIKPTNILINQNGRAFLADSYFINGGRISYQIVMEDPESLSLLSPGQLESLRNKKFVSLKQVHQDQMFSIGLSMMEAMTAQPAMECYDLANLKIRSEFFSRKYDQMVGCEYSPQLAQLVMACIHFDPARRIKFPEFLQAINSNTGQAANPVSAPNNMSNRMSIKNF